MIEPYRRDKLGIAITVAQLPKTLNKAITRVRVLRRSVTVSDWPEYERLFELRYGRTSQPLKRGPKKGEPLSETCLEGIKRWRQSEEGKAAQIRSQKRAVAGRVKKAREKRFQRRQVA